jgi:phosphoribosylanthranilate isomerase
VHREDLSDAVASAIIRGLKPPAQGVLITYLGKAADVVALCESLGTSIVQLHADVDIAELRKLKDRAPRLSIIKSLVVGLRERDALSDLVRRSAEFVDAYITDTFDPQTGATGATGKTHDWSVSRQLVRESPRPVILAGGLNPDNVRDAIRQVRPAGVDAHTGLENATGRKSEEKVKKFMREAMEAFNANRQ